MTIKMTAYDTTVLSGYVTEKTINALQTALISYRLNQLEETDIYLVESDNAGIPAFAHPMLVTKDPKYPDEKELVVDVRAFGSWDPRQLVYNVRNKTEFGLATHRAKLNRIWITESPTLLRDVSTLPMAVYARWIGDALGRRYALDPRERLNVAIIAAIFYSYCFIDFDIEENEREKVRIGNAVSRAMKLNAKEVLDMIDEIGTMSNLNAFCNRLAQHSGSVRLKDMNAGILITIIKGSWFGSNPEEMLGVALEHPPTWLAILSAAFSERSFKNSTIGQLVENGSFKDASKDFMRAILNLTAITKYHTEQRMVTANGVAVPNGVPNRLERFV